jgi:hypothetical protein
MNVHWTEAALSEFAATATLLSLGHPRTLLGMDHECADLPSSANDR